MIFHFFVVSFLMFFFFHHLSLGSFCVNVSLVQSCRCISLARVKVMGNGYTYLMFLEKLAIGHFTVRQNHLLGGIW